MKEQELIRVVTGLTRLYEKYAGIDDADFNIFSILRKKKEEVGLHSRFIYELLNPQGTHGKDAEFLAAFLETVREFTYLPLFDNDSLRKSEVEKETDHIDIYIGLPDGYTIIVENKIDAPDQDKQLERYQRTVIDEYNRNPAKLITLYLTLDGHSPTASSVGDSECEINEISYVDHILKWLDKCIEISDKNSGLLETILQYKSLVCELTEIEEGESDLDREIINVIINDKESFKSAEKIGELLPIAQTAVMQEVFAEIKKQLTKKTNTEPFDNTADISEYYRKGSYPNIAYPIKSFSKDGGKYYFCFFVEIYDCVNYGFCFVTPTEDGKCEWAEKELIKENNPIIYKSCEKAVNSLFDAGTDISNNNICLYWADFHDGSDECYNFGSFSENCIDLHANLEQEVKRMCKLVVPLINKVKDSIGS